MTLLVAVLFAVGTTESDNQTDLSIGDITQMKNRPS